MSLHRWVARWLLHWAELDFAEEVLRSIPSRVSDSDTSVQAEWDLLKALREAERDASVFPLSVPAKDWWTPMPHTKLPRFINDDQLHSWKPARVEAVDRANSKVSFLAAQCPETPNGTIDFEEIQLPWEKVKAAAYKFRSTELTAGMYVEFAYYGMRKHLRIGLHRDSAWNDARLLPLVPPPDRWYQRAVSTAWDSLQDERTAQ